MCYKKSLNSVALIFYRSITTIVLASVVAFFRPAEIEFVYIFYFSLCVLIGFVNPYILIRLYLILDGLLLRNLSL